MGKVKWGAVKIGGKKIYSLAYADDLVMMAEKEDEGYLDGKRLEVNTEKTKVMRFMKRGGKQIKRD